MKYKILNNDFIKKMLCSGTDIIFGIEQCCKLV